MEKKIDTCGVPTPRMGPWKREVHEPLNMPRYAKVDGLAVPDVELRRLHLEERLSAKQIGERIGEEAFFVRARLRKLKIYDRKIRSFRKELDVGRISFMYQQGYSPVEIGRIMMVGKNTVVRRLKRVGILMRNRNPAEYVKAKIKSGVLGEDALKIFSCRRGKDRWRKSR